MSRDERRAVARRRVGPCAALVIAHEDVDLHRGAKEDLEGAMEGQELKIEVLQTRLRR